MGGKNRLTPGLFHCTALVLYEPGPSSLKPKDSGAAGKVGSENSPPRLKHCALSASKSWLRYFTALALVPNPAANARFLARLDAIPDIISEMLYNVVITKKSTDVNGKFCCDSPPKTFTGGACQTQVNACFLNISYGEKKELNWTSPYNFHIFNCTLTTHILEIRHL